MAATAAAEVLQECSIRGHWGEMNSAEVAARGAAKAAAIASKHLAKSNALAGRPSAKRERSIQCHLLRDIVGNPFHPTTVADQPLARTTVEIAQQIYDERAFDRLPLLADALEEAGCQDTNILAHCRHPGPHVRGCWVVDSLLGKE
jgi:hypothetical protein